MGGEWFVHDTNGVRVPFVPERTFTVHNVEFGVHREGRYYPPETEIERDRSRFGVVWRATGLSVRGPYDATADEAEQKARSWAESQGPDLLRMLNAVALEALERGQFFTERELGRDYDDVADRARQRVAGLPHNVPAGS